MKKTGILVAMLAVAGVANAAIVNINALDLRGTGVFGHPDATLISGPANNAVTNGSFDFVMSYANLNLEGDATANDTVNFTVRFTGTGDIKAWGQGIDNNAANLDGLTVSVLGVSGTTTDNGWNINFDGFTGAAFASGGGPGTIDSSVDVNGITGSIVETPAAWAFYTEAVDFASPAATVVFSNTDRQGIGSLVARNYDLQFSAVPEPATIGMVAVFGGGILFIRRRFMM